MSIGDSNRILQACFAFLVPFARLMLRSGVSYRQFAEISRLAFVDVASRDYGLRGRPTNMSRVSAMTGIGRKEVRRLRLLRMHYDQDLQSHLRTQFNTLGDVLHYWYTDPAYLDAEGRPRQLPLRGEKSFEQLVKRCIGDLPVGAVKFELVRCGAVKENSNGQLIANRRVVIPAELDEKLVTALAVRLRGLALTTVYNCTPKNEGENWVEREVYSTQIPTESLGALRSQVKDRVMAWAGDLDDLMSKLEVASQDESRHRRVGVGFFYYEEPD